MKCIKSNLGKIERLSEEKAQLLVNRGDACFIPKFIWKKEVRDKSKTIEKELIVDNIKSSDSVKSKNRKALKQ